MIFSVLLLAIVGIVGFFQYVQGFFSATISAILTMIAAAVAKRTAAWPILKALPYGR